MNPVNGILLLNKPTGLSSNAILQRAKRVFNAKKAGHTGSLDPLATGMLPICFGEATKVCQYLLDEDKVYTCTGLLGIKTSTGDAEGEVIATQENVLINKEQLLKVIESFIGLIQQVPSMFSALKHQGVPLYKLAREGKTIERKSRQITIYAIDLLNFDGTTFELRVSCSKGTYIRSLVEDIGEALGTFAHVTQLHRVHTAGFSTEKMYTLEEIKSFDSAALQQCLLPLERAIETLPLITVTDNDKLALQQGKIIAHCEHQQGLVRLHDSQNFFIGIGELTENNQLKAKRLLAF